MSEKENIYANNNYTQKSTKEQPTITPDDAFMG